MLCEARRLWRLVKIHCHHYSRTRQKTYSFKSFRSYLLTSYLLTYLLGWLSDPKRILASETKRRHYTLFWAVSCRLADWSDSKACVGLCNINLSVPAKEPELAISDVPPTQSSQGEGLGKLYVPRLRGLKNRSCSALCTRILYVTFALITAVQSVAVIAVTVTAALATKIYSDDLSGRLVAMVVLAVTAAVTISVGIYAAIGAIRKQRKPVHSASMVLAVVVVIQAIILGMAVRVTVDDEVKLGRSLSESFRLSRDDSPRHVKLWARTQHDLSCCGVYSAEDYRSANLPLYFAPNVPISCCASYDPGRSELVQERERESCKARKEYYDVGCRNLIIDVFKDTAKSVLGVSLLAVVLEILCILIGIILSIQSKPKPEIDCERQAPAVVTTTEKKTKSKS